MDLQGQIERVTFLSDESGYGVIRVRVPGRTDLVTVVGPLMAVTPGEILRMEGEWSQHPRYGEQFRVSRFTTMVPATVVGIQRYLGSGLMKGIGPQLARRLVGQFGAATLDVLERTPERFREVEGIGPRRLERIVKGWEEQREIREVMLFLQSHSVSPALAVRIFKQYGKDAIALVRENPYRLAGEVYGIGFKTADRIAGNLGFPQDSLFRVEAGILHVLNTLTDEGHFFYAQGPLIARSREILEVEEGSVGTALGGLILDRRVVVENEIPGHPPDGPEGSAVYLSAFHHCETGIAKRLAAFARAPKGFLLQNPQESLSQVQARMSLTLSKGQVAAIEAILEEKVMIVTGGPGTGKTTLIRAALRVFQRQGARTLLAAPTGRAAKRMTEATGSEARTLHRLLEFSPQVGGFQRNEKNPLSCDLLIVDEVSMLDGMLMYHLLKALPAAASLILVGDPHQLPSVGPGNVLADLIGSGRIPVVSLREIFRQARNSQIVVNAHRIHAGSMPYTAREEGGRNDFFFVEREDPEEVVRVICRLVTERIPLRFGLDPLMDIQVLTPMNRGVVGAVNLNLRLQQVLNPGEAFFVRAGRGFRPGDKVMQIRNNYEKDVFNGDIGRIARMDLEAREVGISFDGREVPYDLNELDEVVLAYATTVHKAQGSEYPAVVVPVLTQHYMLLQRNLLYTAVTRGKRLVVLIGTKKALAMAVKNAKTRTRNTLLKERLQGVLAPRPALPGAP